jgi:hypothetical protein
LNGYLPSRPGASLAAAKLTMSLTTSSSCSNTRKVSARTLDVGGSTVAKSRFDSLTRVGLSKSEMACLQQLVGISSPLNVCRVPRNGRAGRDRGRSNPLRSRLQISDFWNLTGMPLMTACGLPSFPRYSFHWIAAQIFRAVLLHTESQAVTWGIISV